MAYKAFQDWYYQASIRHLLLFVYNNNLVSPPFATELCKDYNKILVWNRNSHEYIEVAVPEATSKFNSAIEVDGSLYLIPYAIYDQFNCVIELRDKIVFYHYPGLTGTGQYYSAASSGNTGFSFPLGYSDTNIALYIKNRNVIPVSFEMYGNSKLHMGTVYCNNKYWSMPRGDKPDYNNLVSWDGNAFKNHILTDIPKSISRKYTDIVVVNNNLYSLPYGETKGLNSIVKFDTDTNQTTMYEITGIDFAKKYNTAVLLDKKIIALPYGDEHCFDSNWGLVFDTITGSTKQFDIDLKFGGKYRFRSAITYANKAYFFPSGTPSCPIFVIDSSGSIIQTIQLSNWMLGRPVIYCDLIFVMAYDISTTKHYILSFDEHLKYTVEFEL